ncbi:MAG: SDR family oxidoreductase [Clostridia bacterium]|nr:SDR family oxidoreductase [Clostridia bacterium]
MVKRKTVLITGASGGIGSAIAEYYAYKGYDVIVCCHRNDVGADATVKLVKGYTVNAVKLCFDVADAEQTERAVRGVLRDFGGVDVLVNNAGVACIRDLKALPTDKIDEMLSVNLKGTINTVRALYDSFVAQKHGFIVNLASMWGETGASCEAVYSAAKAGVIGFTKALSKELAPCNVLVNCVSPGVIATKMLDELSDNDIEELGKAIPLGRIGTPMEVAKAVFFLGNSENTYITGEVLRVNGGILI